MPPIELPADSGLDLTATTPVGPQTRDPVAFVLTPRQRRLRFWRRSDENPYLYGGHTPVSFDGSTTYLSRGGNLTGIADGGAALFYCKFTPGVVAGSARTLLIAGVAGSTMHVNIRVTALGAVAITFQDADGDLATNTAAYPNGTVVAGETYQLCVFIDLSSGFYTTLQRIGSASDSRNQSAFISISGDAGFNWGTVPPADWRIGANLAVTPAAYFDGTIHALWFGTDLAGWTDVDQFFDYTGDGADVDLGDDGTLSGLARPLIFFGGRQTVADWNAGTNQGDGGPFAMTGGVT